MACACDSDSTGASEGEGTGRAAEEGRGASIAATALLCDPGTSTGAPLAGRVDAIVAEVAVGNSRISAGPAVAWTAEPTTGARSWIGAAATEAATAWATAGADCGAKGARAAAKAPVGAGPVTATAGGAGGAAVAYEGYVITRDGSGKAARDADGVGLLGDETNRPGVNSAKSPAVCVVEPHKGARVASELLAPND